MISGFDFTVRNIGRLFVLFRYARARRRYCPRAAAACFTTDANFWIIEQDGGADLVRVQGRDAIATAIRQIESIAVLLRTYATRTEWNGDEVTSFWRALVRSPGTGDAYWQLGYSKINFRGMKIAQMTTIMTGREEAVRDDIRPAGRVG